MNLTTQLQGNFPKTIDKEGKVFSSLIVNENGDAAIQKQIAYLQAFMKEWISTPDIYKQTGTMLDKTIRFFSFLERFADETEANLKNRFRAIFVRNHDTKWGTPFDVKNVFRQYFPSATIYLVENTNKIDSVEPGLANILLDGDINTDSPTEWVLTNCSAKAEARFSKAYGVEMNQAGGILSQTVTVNPDSTYFLHFFLKGKCKASIKTNHNLYWDNNSKTWSENKADNYFASDDWNNMSMFFRTGEGDSSVTVSFEYADELAYLDYFRLFLKQPYSSFTLLAHFEGQTAAGVFGLAAGDDDPNVETASETPPQPRYGNYGYYDKSFLSGVPVGFAQDIYEDLLDYLRSQGVRANLEIVIRDFNGVS